MHINLFFYIIPNYKNIKSDFKDEANSNLKGTVTLTLDWCPVHKPTNVLRAESTTSSSFDCRSFWISFTPSLRKICSAPASSRDSTTRFWAAWNWLKDLIILVPYSFTDALALMKKYQAHQEWIRGMYSSAFWVILTFCRSHSLVDGSKRRENICCTRASVEFSCAD